MKCLFRLLALSVCFCCLFFAFSVVANAEDVKGYHIQITAHGNGSTTLLTGVQYPFDSSRQTFSYNKSLIAQEGFKITAEYYIASSDKTALYTKGQTVNGKLENVYIDGTINLPSVATYDVTMQSCAMRIIYTDNTNETVNCTIAKNANGFYTIDFNFTADKDVSKLAFFLSSSEYSLVGGKSININLFAGEPTTETEPNTNIVWSVLSSEIESAEVGWLAKIWNKLTSGLQAIVDAIVNLPQNLWNVISEGLEGLFVPDEAYITEYKNKWLALMEDNMGAVWQVVDITYGAWEEVGVADEQNTITLPEVTIPLPGDNTFTFGGYEVKVVPDGFEFLATILKGLIGVVCTISFVNGLRNRYDEVMGVEK